jgi:tetratricopeptide (TPR) repeat protein
VRTVGFCNVRLSKNIEGKACLDEALKLFETLNDTGGQGYIYTGFGIIHRNLGNYKASLESFFKSLELIKGTKYDEVEHLIYYHMGMTYKYMGNLEQALENTLQSLSTSEKFNNQIAEGYTFNTLVLYTKNWETMLTHWSTIKKA